LIELSILEDFIQMVDSEDRKVDIVDLFNDKDEQLRWEKLVEVFDTIQIDNISNGLHEVAEKYKLNRNEEIAVLAYVKFLELMVMKMKLVQDMDQDTQKKNETPNRMYG
tara:strand:- start:3756 stop:4082 length:327 start_codon:yes stop_codon:yes gene_type:complete